MVLSPYKDFASTFLDGPISNAATTLDVDDASVFPSTSDGDFRIRIDTEIMLVTNVVSNTLTVTRGMDGTTAVGHADNSIVEHTIFAHDCKLCFPEIGLLANKPSNPVEGQWYYPTDFGYKLRYDGTKWQNHSLNPNVFMDPPPTTGWTKASGSTLDTDDQYIEWSYADQNDYPTMYRLYRSVSLSTPWHVIAGFHCVGSIKQRTAYSLIVSHSTNNFGIGWNSYFASDFRGCCEPVGKAVAGLDQYGRNMFSNPWFFGLSNDGTNINAFCSNNLITWHKMFELDNVTIFGMGNSPDEVGFGIQSDQGITTNNRIRVVHWELATGDLE